MGVRREEKEGPWPSFSSHLDGCKNHPASGTRILQRPGMLRGEIPRGCRTWSTHETNGPLLFNYNIMGMKWFRRRPEHCSCVQESLSLQQATLIANDNAFGQPAQKAA